MVLKTLHNKNMNRISIISFGQEQDFLGILSYYTTKHIILDFGLVLDLLLHRF